MSLTHFFLKKEFLLSIKKIIFTSFVFIVLMYFSVIGIKNIFRFYYFQTEYQTLLNQFVELKHKNQFFQNQLVFMNDDAFWELYARTHLGYIKYDEEVYKFYNTP